MSAMHFRTVRPPSRRPRGPRAAVAGRLLAPLLLLVAVVAGAPATATAAPDPVPALFDAALGLSADSAPGVTQGSRAVVRRRHAPVRPGVLTRDDGSPRASTGQRIELNLFDDARFTATVTHVARHSPAGHTWSGTLDGVAHGYTALAVHGDALAGYVMMPGAVYRIGRSAAGKQVIEQIDQSKLPREGRPVVPRLEAAPNGRTPDAAPDGSPVIDVMVLYTVAARTAAGGTAGIQAEVALAVASANQAYANSGVSQRLRLVHTGETSIAESGDFDADLTALETSGEVASLRQAKRADLVSLITSNGDNPPFCGLAYVMSVNTTAFAPFALSVVELLCATSNLTFAHELGHNMGAHHDPYVAKSDKTIFPYSHGFVDQAAQLRTIMAYNDQCAAARVNCTRVPHFSSPIVTFAGRVLGTASTSDNARTFNETAATVASFEQGLSLSLHAGVNQSTFVIGQTLTASIGLTNPGVIEFADVYAGLVLPDGQTVVFLTGPAAIALGRVDTLASFQPIAAGIDLATSFDASVPNLFSYQWTGAEPKGSYMFFVLATRAGTLPAGSLTGDSILGLATAPFTLH